MNDFSRLTCDIIIPVYNALSQTKRCIASVLKHSSLPFRLVLVNDGSDEFTSSYLREIAASDDRIKLIEKEQNSGFLDTANRGLDFELNKPQEKLPQFKILLNSDTVVTESWLESFKICFDSDPLIAVACPVSSNAENLTVPMPEGTNVVSMGKLVHSFSKLSYPDITTAIGFCMAIRTEVLRTVGLFDKIFSPGYGEDSDYHFKVICEGYRSVLVENCFIYHEADASFSTGKMELVRRNRPVFDRRWQAIYTNELEYHHETKPLNKLISHLSKNKPNLKHDVIFVLPTAKLYGGIIVAYEVINRLIELGIDANAIITSEIEEIQMPLQFTPYFYPNSRWLEDSLPEASLYVATHYETPAMCFHALNEYRNAKLAYLVQGYEGWFPEAKIQDVVATYRSIPNRICVSTWIQKMLAKWDVSSSVISNGVDSEFFVPRNDYLKPTKKQRVLLMAREDPQGSWSFVTSLLKRLNETNHIDVITVGPASVIPEVVELSAEAHGHVDRRQMAKIIRTCDIFVDCSVIQGFGLIGLEAMASGVATVLTQTGGVKEYANDSNSLLVPVGDENALFDAIVKLSDDINLLQKLKSEGRKTAEKLNWDNIAIQYAKEIRHIISDGKSITKDELLEALTFFNRQRTAQLIVRESVSLAQGLLVEELINNKTPRGAYDVISQRGAFAELQNLKTTIEGQAIVKVYEQARQAISETRERTEVLREIFTKDDTRGLPLLEKIIEATKQIN